MQGQDREIRELLLSQLKQMGDAGFTDHLVGIHLKRKAGRKRVPLLNIRFMMMTLVVSVGCIGMILFQDTNLQINLPSQQIFILFSLSVIIPVYLILSDLIRRKRLFTLE